MHDERPVVSHIRLGTMAYDEALQLQMKQADSLLHSDSPVQTLYTVEHPPTITIGRSGSAANIVADAARLEAEGVSVFEVDRGGDVTFHGPGQLVVYPVLHLTPWQNDVGRYVRMLEESVIRGLAEVGLYGVRDAAYPGVWVGGNKICAVGCRIKRRSDGSFVTYHGIALNLETPLHFFDLIIPCGIQDKGVTSVRKELHPETPPPTMDAWESLLLKHFSDVFDVSVKSDVVGQYGGGSQ